jgi:hypothetical protein
MGKANLNRRVVKALFKRKPAKAQLTGPVWRKIDQVRESLWYLMKDTVVHDGTQG